MSEAQRSIVSGDRRRTCAEVHERSARAAAGFRALGAGVGDAVAILMRNSIEFLEATHALGRIGAYAVPLNWHLAPEEVAYVLEDCGAKALVAHADLLPLVPGRLLGSLALIVVDVPAEVAAAYPAADQAPAPARALRWEDWLAAQAPLGEATLPDARESIIYTSGTTGRPKGVVRAPATPAQRAALSRMRAETYRLDEGIRLLVPAPMYHAAPNVFAQRGLEVAQTTVILPRFDPEDFLRRIEAERIDTVVAVPTMFIRLLRLPEEVRARHDLSSLRSVLHAAAPCPPQVKRAMIDWLGPILHEWYGTTETSAVTRCDSHEWLARPGTVGRAIPGARVEILDEAGRRLPANTPGEIFMILEFMPDFTYRGRPEDRAAAGRDGMITGGDIGCLDEDGYLFVCDRKKDMVISGGVNIYPAEIEAAMIGLDGIEDCAVIGVPDAEYGEALHALVVARDGIAEDAIRRFLAGRLARFKIPRSFEFRASLPRDDVGKLLKRRLREDVLARRGETATPAGRGPA
ncbi:AMP-binding protein [uncultured Albimonas sp.]|uniref:AMP-binding protein n=1 Tax=uncultured Albimonas sp. TaxID=1331701 RepID=UPI0030EC58D2|tara:strand:+ start:2563 stop:4119 length:1557 start_codon:yes stop_codon:yes gene_type:complete